ncbi:MAG: DUF423 domain-containing protein [Bacteroidia bacterium]|nr:DUF423 domain-containing protein [Bacteroidia bacterium]MBT8277453.1 DUF423 domain-containing protein [Bacteroidia bacterium]NND24494.1 DUF423 domain-containing protein [Flavobacteriaceae bacterium]NNK60785.1 DUF423 domain-containing protein [Flavobacteriaceae bacterium]NNL32835.1 DUF423 domain-containing protein [Flavobacteriaceae bacterium]
MDKKILITGAVFGLLSVVLGAFAAHGLKPKIEVSAMDSFQTGVRYQMYHALLLLLVGSTKWLADKYKKIVYILILGGVLLFSGSIYALSTNVLTAIDFKPFGFITPIGGLLLILSWGVLILNFVKKKSD